MHNSTRLGDGEGWGWSEQCTIQQDSVMVRGEQCTIQQDSVMVRGGGGVNSAQFNKTCTTELNALPVVVEEVVCEVMEEVSLLWAEEATVDLVNSFLQFWVSFIVLLGIVSRRGEEGGKEGGVERGREGGWDGGRKGRREGGKEGGRREGGVEGGREGGREGRKEGGGRVGWREEGKEGCYN